VKAGGDVDQILIDDASAGDGHFQWHGHDVITLERDHLAELAAMNGVNGA